MENDGIGNGFREGLVLQRVVDWITDQASLEPKEHGTYRGQRGRPNAGLLHERRQAVELHADRNAQRTTMPPRDSQRDVPVSWIASPVRLKLPELQWTAVIAPVTPTVATRP